MISIGTILISKENNKVKELVAFSSLSTKKIDIEYFSLEKEQGEDIRVLAKVPKKDSELSNSKLMKGSEVQIGSDKKQQ